MVFTSYDELRAAVNKRRAEILTLEIDLGADYSPEYEEAKQALMRAKVMEEAGAGAFLGETTVADLEQRVADLAPEPNSIYVRYSKLDLGEWTALTKMAPGTTAMDQYERVLVQTFIGLYGQDPVKPESWDEEHPEEEWIEPEPLTTDAAAVSTRSGECVLPPGAVNGVVQSFIQWQNSGGGVTIRPTKSGRA